MVVGIVGLGLIGGSLAKAYKASGGNTVYAFDLDPEAFELASIAGAADGPLDQSTIALCELILIAVNPAAAINWLESRASLVSKRAIVIDCCGVKANICAVGFGIAGKYGFTFVGGHPMAGTHNSGFKHSRANLFRGASMILVPPRYDDMGLLGRAKELLDPVGFAGYTITTAKKHDEMIAFSSQLGHVVSNAFIKSPAARQHKGFSAGSYRDLTRVAHLNAAMWTELFLENKDNLINELDTLLAELEKYRSALKEHDGLCLKELLDEGSRIKDEVDQK